MNVENALNWLKTNKLKFWRIQNNEKEIVAKIDDDSIDLNDSVMLLSQNLEYLPDGAFKIFAKQRKEQTAGELTFILFKKPVINSSIGYANDVSSEAIKQLQNEIQALKDKEKMLEIEKKFEKQLEEKNKIIEKMRQPKAPPKNDMIGKFIDLFIAKAMGGNIFENEVATATISKPIPTNEHQKQANEIHNEDEQEQVTENESEIMQNAFAYINEALETNNIKMLDFIYSVGQSAKKSPQSFCSYADIIISQNPLEK